MSSGAGEDGSAGINAVANANWMWICCLNTHQMYIKPQVLFKKSKIRRKIQHRDLIFYLVKIYECAYSKVSTKSLVTKQHRQAGEGLNY